jgi:hypothetical protein
MAVSLIIALVTAARISGPSIRPDEWGYLLNGQVLIGHEEVRLPFSSMYPAGFGFITGAWAWVAPASGCDCVKPTGSDSVSASGYFFFSLSYKRDYNNYNLRKLQNRYETTTT